MNTRIAFALILAGLFTVIGFTAGTTAKASARFGSHMVQVDRANAGHNFPGNAQ
jgi:hypothetical protein